MKRNSPAVPRDESDIVLRALVDASAQLLSEGKGDLALSLWDAVAEEKESRPAPKARQARGRK